MQGTNQNGRSMIEMLGVLAIIGVLSVGGIAGFSKAMEKYRVNKTIQQITYIAGNIRTLFGSQKDYSDLGEDNIDLLKRAHLIPEEMIENNTLKNPFGGSVYIGTWHKDPQNETRKDAFFIQYKGIREEACIALATQDWTPEGIMAMSIDGPGILWYDIFYGCSGEDGYLVSCPGGSVSPLPMSVEHAITACNVTPTWMTWFFY